MTDFSYEIPEYLIRIVFATIFGALIGLERDIHGRAAGLRTHILVCLGSALFMIISNALAVHYGPAYPADPGRIASQIITGIGFLGAGTIMKEGFSVRGLTTASCLWVAAAIGMATGGGYFLIAVTVTIIVLITLLVVNKIEKFYKHDHYPDLILSVPLGQEEEKILQLLKSFNLKILFADIEKDYSAKRKNLRLSLRVQQSNKLPEPSVEVIKAIENLGIEIYSLKWLSHELQQGK